MIRKIICPTDFSGVADNAVQYAAKLAQVLEAELLLIHVIPSMIGMLLSDAEDVAQQLDNRCAELHKLFKIQTDYEIDAGSGSLANSIASAKQDNALVVMGTNGADSLYQRFFGANTYQVVRKALCPVLIIPEKVDYRSIGKIVFAWNYQEGEKFSFDELYEITHILHPTYMFLHVTTYKAMSNSGSFDRFCGEVKTYLGNTVTPQFAQIFANNIPKGIDNYMRSSEADLLTVTYLNRRLLRAMFHGQIARKFIDHVTYPILVLHA